MFSTLQLIIAVALILVIAGVRAARKGGLRPRGGRPDYSPPESPRSSLRVVDVDASTPLFEDSSTPK